MKKNILGLLCLILSVALPLAASAQPHSQPFSYTLRSDGTATITGLRGMEGDIMIPAMLDGYPVTAISVDAFSGRSDVRSLVLPEGILSIEYYAITSCPNLQSVTLPSSLTWIDSEAFFGCQGIVFTAPEVFLGYLPRLSRHVGGCGFLKCWPGACQHSVHTHANPGKSF